MHGTKPVANMRCAMHGKRTSEEQGRKPRSYASAKLCPVTESQSQRVELKILHLFLIPQLGGCRALAKKTLAYVPIIGW